MSSRKRRLKRQIRILMRMDEQVRSYYPHRKLVTNFHIADAMTARLKRWGFQIGQQSWLALEEPYRRQIARIKQSAANRQRLEDLAMWRDIHDHEMLDRSVPL